MKISGDIQFLDPYDSHLRIEPDMASTSGIGHLATLEAVYVIPPEAEANASVPRATLIATPLPESSWGRLVRMSVTLAPRPGALGDLLGALNRLRLHCRYVETINDIDLQGRSLLGLDRNHHKISTCLNPDSADQDLSSLIIPSTFLIIEVPANLERIEVENQDDTLRVHEWLLGLAQAEPGQNRGNGEVVIVLQKILNEGLAPGENRLAVDWISPMSTLNALARRMESHRSSRVLLVSKKGEDQFLDLSPLRHVLWDPNPVAHALSLADPRGSIFVKGFFDSDEKVLCWDFYQFRNDLVVRFELKTPTSGREHLWWRWVYECLRGAGGNVLASNSSAWLEGGWAILITTVVFPLHEDQADGKPGDIQTIVECFRKLQGVEGYTEYFGQLAESLNNEKGDTAGSGTISKSSDSRLRSVLQSLKVWDPVPPLLHRHREYADRFDVNPFNFTSPLNLKEYQKLYGEDLDDIRRTRRRLAIRIIQKLAGEPGENIAIVGAHRAGKTTVLNLVFDILEEGSYGSELPDAFKNVNLIPVRINAALEPPHGFFSAIRRELEARKKSKVAAVSLQASEYLNLLAPIITAFEVSLGTLYGVPLAFGLEGLRGIFPSGKNRLSPRPSTLHDSPEVFHLLKLKLEDLRKALASISGGSKLVVIVDEFSDSSRWGQEQALPLWRHVIESREFTGLKWLISTSRPIKDASDYSPITNALHEFNVGSLPSDESELLVDAFSVLHWRRQPLSVEEAGNVRRSLHPVVTIHARRFLQEVTSRLAYLMQVVCYHVYDRSCRTYVPLISRRLCIDIVCDHVLPELSDYLEHQWAHIPIETKRLVENSLQGFSGQKEFLRNMDKWVDNVHDLRQGERKALERSGLSGDGFHCIAPLVACWTLSPSRSPQFKSSPAQGFGNS